jgi:hypothetical protein
MIRRIGRWDFVWIFGPLGRDSGLSQTRLFQPNLSIIRQKVGQSGRLGIRKNLIIEVFERESFSRWVNGQNRDCFRVGICL